jgi:Sulfatase
MGLRGRVFDRRIRSALIRLRADHRVDRRRHQYRERKPLDRYPPTRIAAFPYSRGPNGSICSAVYAAPVNPAISGQPRPTSATASIMTTGGAWPPGGSFHDRHRAVPHVPLTYTPLTRRDPHVLDEPHRPPVIGGSVGQDRREQAPLHVLDTQRGRAGGPHHESNTVGKNSPNTYQPKSHVCTVESHGEPTMGGDMALTEYPVGTTFPGRIGRTIGESDLAWPKPNRAQPGAANVVFIVLDDTGYGQFGCYGSPINTPSLDRLATNGLLYTNMHTTALCSPSRSCMLTGRCDHSNGMACITEGSTGFPGWAEARVAMARQ